ncbi:hypothetical protein IFM89_025484 [Coptis chinensis]|uniref:RING-type E3 ubiquitin transferase n=1 Tax=Coptis chinensis TaxID=261450 RepID=A0A835LSW1_9MAGN|nr:hypothetical protein IFM89_025484 [Coptis chinensis]
MQGQGGNEDSFPSKGRSSTENERSGRTPLDINLNAAYTGDIDDGHFADEGDDGPATESSIAVNHPLPLSPQYGVGRTYLSSHPPALSITGYAVLPQRNSRIRVNPVHLQDVTPSAGNSIRLVRSPFPSFSNLLAVDESLNSWPSEVQTNAQIPSHLIHVPVNHPPHLNSQYGVGSTGLSSYQPASSVTGFSLTSHINSRTRVHPVHPQDTTPSAGNLTRVVRLPSQTFSNILTIDESLNSWPPERQTSFQSPSHLNNIPVVHGPMDPFATDGTFSSRVGSSSSVIFEERTSVLSRELQSRNRRMTVQEVAMYVPSPPDLTTSAHGPTNLDLTNSNISISDSISHVGPNSMVHRPSASVSVPVPHYNGPPQYFVQVDSEPEDENNAIPPFLHTSRGISQEMGRQGDYQHYPGPALRPGIERDVFPGVPSLYQTWSARNELTNRLLSEIHRVLDLLRDNARHLEELRIPHIIASGILRMHDRRDNMGLDIDSFSYEELQALEEELGAVTIGLSEETISRHLTLRNCVVADDGSCCICQEAYVEGEELGTLHCEHNFHSGCIKQWLMEKNVCPICRTTALPDVNCCPICKSPVVTETFDD